jgi:hypothetical protein
LRLFLLIIGIIAGLFIGYFLIMTWLIIDGYVLGHGDSAHGWRNSVPDIILAISIPLCAIMSQALFNVMKKRGKIKHVRG